MTRTRWTLIVAISLALVIAIIAIILGRPTPPQVTEPPSRDVETPSATAAPTPSPAPTPAPSELIDIPGYDPAPGPLDLGTVDPARTAVTAALALGKGAVNTGGTTGLSFDATDFANPAWGSPGSNLQRTLAELDRPVLRFGGNGVDRRMWWTSDGEPAPSWAEATVTPADLERVATVARRLDAQVTVVVDLGHDDPARAADMAARAREAFGDRLIAVAIGNEPNGFHHPNQPQLEVRGPDWGVDQYQAAVTEYAAAIEKLAPGTPIAGPGTYDAPWWRAFAELDLPQAHALTMHWYPLWDCTGPDESIANPTVEDLTSPAIRERAQWIVGMGRDVADAHNLPLWMEETGPTSCAGTNETSRTHAQALWTTDFVMTALAGGVERIAFHATLDACKGGAPMSPVCATGRWAEPGQLITARTSFLALMQLGWIPDGQVLTPTVGGNGEVMVHGVLTTAGQLALTIVDMRDPHEAANSGAVPVTVSAPTGLAEDAPMHWQISSGSRLTGAALNATASTLGAMAPVEGDLAEASLRSDSDLTVPSAAGSVTMLLLEPEDGTTT